MEKLGQSLFFKLVIVNKKKPTAEVTLSSGYNASGKMTVALPAEAVTRH